jgi:YD repeat-containing protein
MNRLNHQRQIRTHCPRKGFAFGKVQFRSALSVKALTQSLKNTVTFAVGAQKMTTRYTYNTLNQVKRERSPDKGETQFWYDKIGRPIISQDARQLPLNKYSYTIYDLGTGRIQEVGELVSATAMTDATAFSSFSTDGWIAAVATSKIDITQTTYDQAIDGAPGFGAAGQENLRYRISKVGFYKTQPLLVAKIPESTTHYSYDALGNVKTLIQDLRHLQRHRYKRVDYNYDFVSGKVNSVYYQKDSADQYIHKYLYDANNRLTTVQTYFIDGFISSMGETDANYSYYAHGPL